MKIKASTDSDMGKLVLEGMVTVLIVLIFLFIAQNWALSKTDVVQNTDFLHHIHKVQEIGDDDVSKDGEESRRLVNSLK